MEGRDLETPEGIQDLGKRVAIEASNGAVPSMWSFICNLPGFAVLFLLGISKGELRLLLSFWGDFVLFLVLLNSAR